LETTAAPSATTAAITEQPEHAPKSQSPAIDDGTHPLEADALNVEPTNDIAALKAAAKLEKKARQKQRAKSRAEKASDAAAEPIVGSSATTTTASQESTASKAALTHSKDGTQPLATDSMALKTVRDLTPLKESIKKPLTRPQRKKLKAQAALNDAKTVLDDTTATLPTVKLKAVPAKMPPTNATASKPSSRVRTLASKTAWMLRDTGTLVNTIASTSLESDSTEVSSKAGFETLCSYNWQMDGTIFVPGGPPRWTPPLLPVTLPQDKGSHFMDQNAYRVPKYPFEPAFQGLSIMNPNMNLDTVDIVANRNSFRKLIDFAAGSKRDPWCMGLHMVNNTLFISRKEKHATQMIFGAANSGYGHNFEKAFTKPEDDMDNSSSHHRVIRYHIGSLDCVVRFEVDAYYDDPDAVPEPAEDMATAMTQLKIQDQPPIKSSLQQNTSAEKTTQAIQKGTLIDPSKLAEIKAKRLNRVAEALPQLWFGRTPWFMNGNHNKGRFDSVTIAHAEDLYPRWEENNQDRLRKMVSLLGELRRVVQATGGRAAVLVCEKKGGDLKIYEMKRDGGVLPVDIIKRHWSVRTAGAK
jgi:hypothetical protein